MPPTVKLAAAVPSGAVALVVAITPGTGDPVVATLGRGAAGDIESFGADPEALLAVLTREKTKGHVGDAGALPVGARLILAAGLGEGTPRDYRRAGAAVARRLKGVESAAITVARRSNPAQIKALTEGLLLGGYSFKVTNSPKPETLTSVTLVVDQVTDAISQAVAAGVTTATASALARDLANTPSSTKNPAWLARQATGLARKSGLEVRVRDDRELRADGFGGVVAVGMGSVSPPRLIELTYTPDPAIAVDGHVVLVGKGITFDSGGLSLKPNAGMIAMKTDMAAGGAIIAAMSVMRELGFGCRSPDSCRPRRTCPQVRRSDPATSSPSTAA